MGVRIHLLMLILTVLAIAITLALDRGPAHRSLRHLLLGAIPVLLIGLVSSLLLLAGGKPLLE